LFFIKNKTTAFFDFIEKKKETDVLTYVKTEFCVTTFLSLIRARELTTAPTSKRMAQR
jgi:hypothetical protein